MREPPNLGRVLKGTDIQHLEEVYEHEHVSRVDYLVRLIHRALGREIQASHILRCRLVVSYFFVSSSMSIVSAIRAPRGDDDASCLSQSQTGD